MRVAIVGGGIAGLALGSRLRSVGMEATVLERTDLRGPAGAGLSLMPNGIRALGELGLGERVRDACGETRTEIPGGIRSSSGRLIAPISRARVAGIQVVDRALLRECLLSSLDEGGVRLRSQVDGIDSSRDKPVVRLSTGEEICGVDLVVGADGLRSSVRRELWGSDDPGIKKNGYFACRGITSETVKPAFIGETWGDARRFGMVPLPDGRVYWFSVANGEPVASGEAHQWTRDNFGGWSSSISDVINGTDPAGVQPLPIESLSCRLSSYVRGRVVLVGDAAHAMSPNLGQGANQALEDVAALAGPLADVLRGKATLEAALARYDRKRRRKSQFVAAASDVLGAFAQAEGSWLAKARNFALSAG